MDRTEEMEDFGLIQMQNIQKELQERYKHKWEAIGPQAGRNKLLWLIGELGEVIDIVKKEGDRSIMENEEIRRHFVEEMCDVLMYFNDVMLCYDVSVEELKESYLEKHRHNMGRW